jgi:16S rRNA G966 N2-methylase RsmD
LNKLLLNTVIQEFINLNLNSDIAKLLLKGTTFEGVETREIIEQIEAKKRCKNKLPSWFQTDHIYYPNKLNIEQTSSEITANYKSKIIHGKTLIDLTGGFGVDDFYFAKHFRHVTHCEINSELAQIVKHNYEVLSINNIETVEGDGISHIKSNAKSYDWMYIDPSRRSDSRQKVFFLKECIPNVLENLDTLFTHSNQILIKTSPLLDISIGIDELKYVSEIHIVAVKNEVKELLWVLNKNYTELPIKIYTVNITNNETQKFEFNLKDESDLGTSYSEPQSYLYEPNAAILKSGGFTSIAKACNVHKLHKHSHLYTSNELVLFPGRSFKIERILPYKKDKSLLQTKANITTRNFPESVAQIRKKLKIKEGGDSYIFATTTFDALKVLLICKKIKTKN